MRVLLAPMEGVLDSLVRELLSEVNDSVYDLCITEFLRVVDQLLPVKSFHCLCPELHNASRTPSGTRVRLQLLGQYPEWLAENAARAAELGSWGVDLNCGCPSKLVNGGGGATLLKDPELLYRGAKAMREAEPAHLPVTVKVRLGWDSGERRFEIDDAVQQAGASELVVHGRTKEDGYRAEAINWQAIGAPLGVMLNQSLGTGGFAGLVALMGVVGYVLASRKPAVDVCQGQRISFHRVWLFGLALGFGTIGFGVISTFITLYFASRDWSGAAFALSLFSLGFVLFRLGFSSAITRFGGLKVALVSFLLECTGLLIIWQAETSLLVDLGALLTGCGFSLIFPALGVEAVKQVERQDQGSALGVYSAFLDLGLGLTGPVAGLLIGYWGMQSVYLAAALMVLGAFSMTLRLSIRTAKKERKARQPAEWKPAASEPTPWPDCVAWRVAGQSGWRPCCPPRRMTAHAWSTPAGQSCPPRRWLPSPPVRRWHPARS